MKPVPILMKQWLEANERTRILPGDQWYLDFSIKTLPILKNLPYSRKMNMRRKMPPYHSACIFRMQLPRPEVGNILRGILCIIV